MSIVTDQRFRLQRQQSRVRMWALLDFREGVEILEGRLGHMHLQKREQWSVELELQAGPQLLQLRYRDAQEQEQLEELVLTVPLAQFATPPRQATLPWQRPLLPVHCQQVSQLQVRLQRLNREQVDPFYDGTENQEDFLLQQWEHCFQLNQPEGLVQVDLSPALPHPHGFVAVELAAEGGWRQSLLLDVSNLGLSYYHLPRRRFLVATHLSEARPCAGLVFPSGESDASGMLDHLNQIGRSWIGLGDGEAPQLGRLGEMEVLVQNAEPPQASWQRGRFFLLQTHLNESQELVVAGWLRRQNSPASPLEPAYAPYLEATCWGQTMRQPLSPDGGFLFRWPWQARSLKLSLVAPGPEGEDYRLELGAKASPQRYSPPESPTPSCALELPEGQLQPGQTLNLRLGLQSWPAHVLLGLWRGSLLQLQNRRVDEPWSHWSFPIQPGMEPAVLVRADAFCAQGHFQAQALLGLSDEHRRLQLTLSLPAPGQLRVQVHPPVPAELLVLLEQDLGESPDPLSTFLPQPECWLTLTSNLDRLPGRQPHSPPEPAHPPDPPPLNPGLYLGLHQSDAQGYLSLELPIPPSSEPYRLRVHASALSDRFGSAAHRF
ncbi:hypothetical protein JST97_09295 [bacterium]|nr:hypothetical protein [bacterium]